NFARQCSGTGKLVTRIGTYRDQFFLSRAELSKRSQFAHGNKSVHQDIDDVRAIGGQPGNKDGVSTSTEFLVNAISPKFERTRGSSTLTGVVYIEPPVPLGNVIREQANEAAVQRSKRKTGNHEPHSDRGRTKKDGADRRTRTPSGSIGTGIGACARSN